LSPLGNFLRGSLKPTHPGRLKKQIWVKKNPQWEPWSHAARRYYRNLRWTFEDLLPCYCYPVVIKSRLQQSASKFRNLTLQAKDRTWVSCAVVLSVSGASRSRLFPDGTRVRTSGPDYMPSCVRPEVRFPLDQRVLCSDCRKKCTMSRTGSLLLFCTA